MRFLFRINTVFLACALFAFPAKSAQLPFLRGPLAYVGEHVQNDSVCKISLFLGDAQNFLLCEKILFSNGDTTSWETSGTWHQIRDNAFVQLTNTKFQRLLSVGGSGNIYLDVRTPSKTEGFKQTAVVLRQQDNATYTEAFGRIPQKKRESGYNPIYFWDKVVNKYWKFMHIYKSDGEKPTAFLLAFISEKNRYGGKIKIFDGVQVWDGLYTLNGDKISLVIDDPEAPFAVLVKQTQFWQIAGDVLELWSDKQITALLEKAR